MRILTLSLNAWNDTKATGNTFSNFFGDFEQFDVEFANIFCRNENVDNHICHRYYKITETDIVNNLFSDHRKPGDKFEYNSATNHSGNNVPQTGLVSSIKSWIAYRWRPATLLFARELLWSVGRWESQELKQFLLDFKPDIIYMHGHNNFYMHHLLWFCQEITNAKIVLFFGDDMYGYKSKMPIKRMYEYFLRKTLKESISRSSLLLGGSFELCTQYSGIFNKKFIPQFKTCNTVDYKLREFSRPYSIVYAGNLLYGRDVMLCKFAESVRSFNSQHGKSYELHVYSNCELTDKTVYCLNDGENTFLHAAVSYKEICRILNDCDICLFIESFRKNDILSTRLSFSTKIIDYLQSSSSLIVIGPNSISSVKYLINSNAGIYIDNLDKIEDTLNSIYDKPEVLIETSSRKKMLAENNHSKHHLLERMETILKSN